MADKTYGGKKRRGALIEAIYIFVGMAFALEAGMSATLKFGADRFNVALAAVSITFLAIAIVLLLVEMSRAG